MEFCDRHDGVHVYYEYHRTWQADCPLCAAIDAVEEKERRIEELSNRLETVEELLAEAQETIRDYESGDRRAVL